MDWMSLLLEMAIEALEKWWTSSLGSKPQTYGYRRSIVRLIGTMLPLPRAKRVHLDLAVWRCDNEHELVSNDSNSVSSMSDFIDEGRGSLSTEAGVIEPNVDMKKLLEEIQDLKTKMNEILQRQSSSSCCGQSTCCTVVSTQKSTDKPNPPPPPPPMPQTPFVHSTPRMIPKKKKKNPLGYHDTQNAKGLSAVLSELKTCKVTLKPVLRSPGGRPLKDSGSESGTPRSSCGGDMLTEILRRRYIKSEITEAPAAVGVNPA